MSWQDLSICLQGLCNPIIWKYKELSGVAHYFKSDVFDCVTLNQVQRDDIVINGYVTFMCDLLFDTLKAADIITTGFREEIIYLIL